MNRSILAAITALAILAAQNNPNASAQTAAPTSLIGWASGPEIAAELAVEQTMMRVPSSANAMEIERHLSSVPHRAGSAADYATALYVQKRLQADGFDTRIQEYQVAFTGPLEQSLTMLAPRREDFDLIEGTPGHPTKWETMAGQPFLEESGDGTVTGHVVYVNAASKDDLAELDARRVNLRGAVAIVRLSAPNGGGFRSLDPTWIAYNELTKRGVVAILEFMDPATSGYGGGAMWPNGNYKNPNMAERMSGMSPRGFMMFPPGDPTSAGIAPTVGTPHKSWNDIPHAAIPELSITQSVARTLLANLGGQVVPQSWHPMYGFVQHFGDAGETVRVHTKFERMLKTIWLVFGDMAGSQDPNSIVMIGSHRDAMTFGAIDPGSGTTVLLQDADAFHALAQQGWRPKRTIEFASWDGHELGLFGSASYIYQYGPQLRQNVFQYINTDQLTTGDPFVVSASPGLFAFMKQICDVVPGRDGTMLGARSDRDRPLLNAMGGGSDHQNFAYMLGVLSTSNGYYGAFGAHHTAEDNLDGLRTYDPGMKEAVITAQVTGIQAMRAAGATVAPLRMEEIPTQMLKDLNDLEAAAVSKGQPVAPYEQIRQALVAYQTAAHQTDLAMAKAEASGDVGTIQSIAAKEQASRDAFYMNDGLLQNAYYRTIDRVFTSLPEIAYAGDNAERLAKAFARAQTAIQNATQALSS